MPSLSVVLSCVWLSATLGTVALRVPLSVGFFQGRILEWVVTCYTWGSSLPRDWTCISYGSCTAGRFFTFRAIKMLFLKTLEFHRLLLRHVKALPNSNTRDSEELSQRVAQFNDTEVNIQSVKGERLCFLKWAWEGWLALPAFPAQNKPITLPDFLSEHRTWEPVSHLNEHGPWKEQIYHNSQAVVETGF